MRKPIMSRRFLGLLIGVMILGCHRYSTVVPIVRTATLSKDWTDFRPAKPIDWSEPDGSVMFHIDSFHHRGFLEDHFDILLADGEQCAPEVEVLGDKGKTLLVSTHGWAGEDMEYYIWHQKSHFKTIQAIRIRSSATLHISDLRWQGYDFEKIKR